MFLPEYLGERTGGTHVVIKEGRHDSGALGAGQLNKVLVRSDRQSEPEASWPA
ncbi:MULTISPECIES: hypothetical protein [Streptomyces]|uniref:hypothetical protein n=1 Tax=Streptomyces TaxID=1883 RepID=UPI000A5908D7|nr:MULTISPECIES: hypothetical protein [Streptomyces]QZY15142.1 hypothetical protein K7C20_07660 [Streptomyces decoyicus]